MVKYLHSSWVVWSTTPSPTTFLLTVVLTHIFAIRFSSLPWPTIPKCLRTAVDDHTHIPLNWCAGETVWWQQWELLAGHLLRVNQYQLHTTLIAVFILFSLSVRCASPFIFLSFSLSRSLHWKNISIWVDFSSSRWIWAHARTFYFFTSLYSCLCFSPSLILIELFMNVYVLVFASLLKGIVARVWVWRWLEQLDKE